MTIDKRTNTEGWSGHLFNSTLLDENNIPTPAENYEKYDNNRPLHDPDNVIPEFIVANNLKKVSQDSGRFLKGNVCEWYIDESDSLNKAGKKNVWVPRNKSKNIELSNNYDLSNRNFYSLLKNKINIWGNINNNQLHKSTIFGSELKKYSNDKNEGKKMFFTIL